MKLLDSSLVQLVLGLTVVVGLWGVGNKVNINLAQLPVEQAADVSTAVEGAPVKPMFPVWVQAAAKQARALEAVDPAAVEAAFGSRAGDIEVEPAPDFAELARGSIKIGGVSSGGAFIGGRFYAIGSKLTTPEAPADGLSATPRLVSVQPERVVFDVGGTALVMTKGDGGWH